MSNAPRIDLHGLDRERATELIHRLIDDAQACGDRRVEIVHGRGEGILAGHVRELLKADPRVSDLGPLDGSAGVWARIKKLSEMPRAPGQPGTGQSGTGQSGAGNAAQTARDLLRAAKKLPPPRPGS